MISTEGEFQAVVATEYDVEEKLGALEFIPNEKIYYKDFGELVTLGLTETTALPPYFWLINLEKEYMIASLQEEIAGGYQWMSNYSYSAYSVVEIIRYRYQMSLSDSNLEKLLSKMQAYRDNPSCDESFELEGGNVLLKIGCAVKDKVSSISEKCLLGVEGTVESIKEVLQDDENEQPESIVLAGKLDLYPTLADKLEDMVGDFFHIIIPEQGESALQRGMKRFLLSKK